MKARKPELRWIWVLIILPFAIGVALFDWAADSDDRLGILIRLVGKYPAAALLLGVAVSMACSDWGVSREAERPAGEVSRWQVFLRSLGFVFGTMFLVLCVVSATSAARDPDLSLVVSVTSGCAFLLTATLLFKSYRKKRDRDS